VLRGLAGYLLEPAAGIAGVWRCVVVVTGTLGDPATGVSAATTQLVTPQLVTALVPAGASPHALRLRPVAQLLPVRGGPTPVAPPAVRTLRPVKSGRAYRITSPAARRLVTPELAEALEAVFERFARARGFAAGKPLAIRLSRGFKAGSHGHGEARAADIDAVGGKSLLRWKQEWDQAMTAAENIADPQQRAAAGAAEQARNLGYGLYKALQAHGGWRVNPGGWRVYRGVMQLFGPWTATEGPWQAMHMDSPTPAQRQRLADQRWVFGAHQDHVHVAR
jgi:hypothetical protein